MAQNSLTEKQYAMIAAVLILVSLVILWQQKRSKEVDTQSPAPVAGSTQPAATGTGSVGEDPSVSPAYAAALKTYAGLRMQFDSRCQAEPTKIVVKNGTSVMLDNRSEDARTVKIGGVSYSLGALGFKIVKLSRTSLPATLDVDCGAQQNVATFLVEK